MKRKAEKPKQPIKKRDTKVSTKSTKVNSNFETKSTTSTVVMPHPDLDLKKL